MVKKRITISWSGGKDSALALYKILTSGEYEVAHLHTVFSEGYKRVGLHGVHESLVEEQAKALSIPLQKLYLKEESDHTAYTTLMSSFYKKCAVEKIEAVMFGDIFLEDLKRYRDNLLHDAGLSGIYPLWKLDTMAAVNDFLNVGFKTLICAADSKYFTEDQMGTTLDTLFLETFNPDVDACGENGEFHTFVYDGPIFKHCVRLSKGEVVSREYRYQVKRENGTQEQLSSKFLFVDLKLSDA